MKPKLSDVYWPLRLSYGLVPLLAGLDKYLGILADWKRYRPLFKKVMPVEYRRALAEMAKEKGATMQAAE